MSTDTINFGYSSPAVLWLKQWDATNAASHAHTAIMSKLRLLLTLLQVPIGSKAADVLSRVLSFAVSVLPSTRMLSDVEAADVAVPDSTAHRLIMSCVTMEIVCIQSVLADAIHYVLENCRKRTHTDSQAAPAAPTAKRPPHRPPPARAGRSLMPFRPPRAQDIGPLTGIHQPDTSRHALVTTQEAEQRMLARQVACSGVVSFYCRATAVIFEIAVDEEPPVSVFQDSQDGGAAEQLIEHIRQSVLNTVMRAVSMIEVLRLVCSVGRPYAEMMAELGGPLTVAKAAEDLLDVCSALPELIHVHDGAVGLGESDQEDISESSLHPILCTFLNTLRAFTCTFGVCQIASERSCNICCLHPVEPPPGAVQFSLLSFFDPLPRKQINPEFHAVLHRLHDSIAAWQAVIVPEYDDMVIASQTSKAASVREPSPLPSPPSPIPPPSPSPMPSPMRNRIASFMATHEPSGVLARKIRSIASLFSMVPPSPTALNSSEHNNLRSASSFTASTPTGAHGEGHDDGNNDESSRSSSDDSSGDGSSESEGSSSSGESESEDSNDDLDESLEVDIFPETPLPAESPSKSKRFHMALPMLHLSESNTAPAVPPNNNTAPPASARAAVAPITAEETRTSPIKTARRSGRDTTKADEDASPTKTLSSRTKSFAFARRLQAVQGGESSLGATAPPAQVTSGRSSTPPPQSARWGDLFPQMSYVPAVAASSENPAPPVPAEIAAAFKPPVSQPASPPQRMPPSPSSAVLSARAYAIPQTARSGSFVMTARSVAAGAEKSPEMLPQRRSFNMTGVKLDLSPSPVKAASSTDAGPDVQPVGEISNTEGASDAENKDQPAQQLADISATSTPLAPILEAAAVDQLSVVIAPPAPPSPTNGRVVSPAHIDTSARMASPGAGDSNKELRSGVGNRMRTKLMNVVVQGEVTARMSSPQASPTPGSKKKQRRGSYVPGWGINAKPGKLEFHTEGAMYDETHKQELLDVLGKVDAKDRTLFVHTQPEVFTFDAADTNGEGRQATVRQTSRTPRSRTPRGQQEPAEMTTAGYDEDRLIIDAFMPELRNRQNSIEAVPARALAHRRLSGGSAAGLDIPAELMQQPQEDITGIEVSEDGESDDGASAKGPAINPFVSTYVFVSRKLHLAYKPEMERLIARSIPEMARPAIATIDDEGRARTEWEELSEMWAQTGKRFPAPEDAAKEAEASTQDKLAALPADSPMHKFKRRSLLPTSMVGAISTSVAEASLSSTSAHAEAITQQFYANGLPEPTRQRVIAATYDPGAPKEMKSLRASPWLFKPKTPPSQASSRSRGSGHSRGGRVLRPSLRSSSPRSFASGDPRHVRMSGALSSLQHMQDRYSSLGDEEKLLAERLAVRQNAAAAAPVIVSRNLAQAYSSSISQYLTESGVKATNQTSMRASAAALHAFSLAVAATSGIAGNGRIDKTVIIPTRAIQEGKINHKALQAIVAQGSMPARASGTPIPLGVAECPFDDEIGENGDVFAPPIDRSNPYTAQFTHQLILLPDYAIDDLVPTVREVDAPLGTTFVPSVIKVPFSSSLTHDQPSTFSPRSAEGDQSVVPVLDSMRGQPAPVAKHDRLELRRNIRQHRMLVSQMLTEAEHRETIRKTRQQIAAVHAKPRVTVPV